MWWLTYRPCRLTLLQTVVEQLVDADHSDAVARKLLEGSTVNSVIGTIGEAPVVLSRTQHDLFGRIEYSTDQGCCIPATGSCDRRFAWANGGYLLEAELLSEPFVWRL